MVVVVTGATTGALYAVVGVGWPGAVVVGVAAGTVVVGKVTGTVTGGLAALAT